MLAEYGFAFEGVIGCTMGIAVNRVVGSDPVGVEVGVRVGNLGELLI